MNIKTSLATGLERFALLIMLIVVVVFFALNPATPEFFTVANLQNLLINQTLLVSLAVATTIPLVAGQIDLSVGPAAGLAALVTAGVMSRQGAPLAVAIMAAVIVGLAIGLVGGLLIARIGISSIVATLGMSSIILAVVYLYSGGTSIVTKISPTLTEFGTSRFLGIPSPVIVVFAICLVAWYVLGYTPVGRNLYAVGASPGAATLVGLSVPKYIAGSLMVAGAMVAVTGVLLVSIQGGANPQLGASFTLPAVAAAFLGGTAYQRGRYNIMGTITAVFFIGVTINGLTLWGFEGWVSDLVNGLSLIIAVGISTVAGRRRSQHAAIDAVHGSGPRQGSDGERVPSLDLLNPPLHHDHQSHDR